jgi:hypothetical protein
MAQAWAPRRGCRGLLENKPSTSCGSPVSRLLAGLQPAVYTLQAHEPVGVAKQGLSPTWAYNSFTPPLHFFLPPLRCIFFLKFSTLCGTP